MAVDSIHFPFKHGELYSIGELRTFERALLRARQADRALSEAWRIAATPTMKEWAKVREETYPLKLLADHKGFSDSATFSLRPFACPDIDADIDTGTERYSLQITAADPTWPGSPNGGYDRRLKLEALNRHGVVHGSGGFRRENGKIVCDHMVIDGSDAAVACRNGIVDVLVRKSGTGKPVADRLLIYTREFALHVADEGYSTVVMDAVSEFSKSGGALGYAAVYVVDEHACVEL